MLTDDDHPIPNHVFDSSIGPDSPIYKLPRPLFPTPFSRRPIPAFRTRFSDKLSSSPNMLATTSANRNAKPSPSPFSKLCYDKFSTRHAFPSASQLVAFISFTLHTPPPRPSPRHARNHLPPCRNFLFVNEWSILVYSTGSCSYNLSTIHTCVQSMTPTFCANPLRTVAGSAALISKLASFPLFFVILLRLSRTNARAPYQAGVFAPVRQESLAQFF